MLSDKEKALLKKLELPYPCVAVKYRFENRTRPITTGENWPIASMSNMPRKPVITSILLQKMMPATARCRWE